MQRQTKGTFSFPDQDQNTQALDSGTFDSHGTKRPSDSTKNNFEEHFVSNKNKNLTSQRSKGVDVKSESQKRDKYHKMKQPFHHPTCMLLESQCVYDYPRTPPVSTDVSIPNQMLNPSISNVRNAIEKSLTERDTNIDKCCSHHDKDIAELKKLKEIKKVPSEGKTDTKSAGQITNSICARLITVTKMGGQIKYTTTEGPIAIINKFTSQIIDMININLMWQKAQTEVGCMKDVKNETNEKHIIYYIKESCREMTKYKEIEASKGMSLCIEQLERHKSTEASEGSMNKPIHPVDRLTTYNSQEDNRIGMRGSMINKTWFIQDNQILISEVNTDISSDESRSTFESTLIRLYRNVIRNDTSRMMSSIDMVGFKAEHLFGLERSRIFFDLLDEELCHFESAGAISEFVPNMAESTVRQHVISFFEHAYDMMSKLMTLLSCPYSKILQQMPVQNFISLMKSVIESSLKAQTKGREKLSLEGNIYIMVDPRDFERALVEEFPEDVLNRLGNEDEIVVNRLYHYIYFPSDCRLYIYIPTATGSYWHHSDMRRADRIRRHG